MIEPSWNVMLTGRSQPAILNSSPLASSTFPRRLRFNLGSRRRPGCRATDVERPHRELRARLADRLRGDHTDRFADVDEMPAAQIATVASCTEPVSGVAGERRAHLDFVDAEHF